MAMFHAFRRRYGIPGCCASIHAHCESPGTAWDRSNGLDGCISIAWQRKSLSEAGFIASVASILIDAEADSKGMRRNALPMIGDLITSLVSMYVMAVKHLLLQCHLNS